MPRGALIRPPGGSQPGSSLLRAQLPATHFSLVLTLSKRKDPTGSCCHHPIQKTPVAKKLLPSHLERARPLAWVPNHWPVFCDQETELTAQSVATGFGKADGDKCAEVLQSVRDHTSSRASLRTSSSFHFTNPGTPYIHLLRGFHWQSPAFRD